MLEKEEKNAAKDKEVSNEIEPKEEVSNEIEPKEEVSNEIEPKDEESLENKQKEIEDKLLRSMAEMENQRRRFEKERADAFEFGGFNFAKESLPLLDNIDRAIESFKNDVNLKNNKDLDKIIDGIEIVKKDLTLIFKKNNVEAIDCINKKFDPNFHQAMLEVEDDSASQGTVIQEIQKGYMMKDRLLRPSLVGVTKKKDKNKEKTSNNQKKTNKEEEKV